MGTPPISVRCPTCGADLNVVLAPAPPTQWFPCPHCRHPVPVVVPRDLPPLYSWEVLPGLYPELPAPRRPKIRMRKVAQVVLALITALSIVLGGVLIALGTEALGPASYSVSGTVTEQSFPRTVPAAGAKVVLTDDQGRTRTTVVGSDGAFSFAQVPPGGISINITQPSYAPVTVETFASPVYATTTTGLSVHLVPGNNSNGTTQSLSPFPDLETFVASIGTAVALLGIVALLAAWGAVVTARSNRPAVGVVGGAGSLLAPVAFYFLSLSGAFPLLVVGSTLLAALGAFVLTVRSLEILQVGPEAREN
ncbi:MAG TPA: carboxypeptidase-like regulatory domain-containing protein [Thermoplasmata archaeon]|nr:carboxypeptidase-like regulatory domain-containing protein [Thermoplasmata archaeon]